MSPAITHLGRAHVARAGASVEIRTINGRRSTNRAGAAEYLNRSLQTINLLASPKRRTEAGWPDPIAVRDGRAWYALTDLDRFRRSYIRPTEQAQKAKVNKIGLRGGDPDELITSVQFRELIGASHGTWSRYVHNSKPAWERGQDGYLPRPEAEQPAPRGLYRFWRRQRAIDWINARPGSTPSPGRRPSRDRARS